MPITKVIYFFSFLFLCSTSQIFASEINAYQLDNGLRLLVQEDHRSPVVVTQVWYKAGSLDEVNGKTGVAHVLEHMMFKGTKTLKDGEFSRRIAAVGGNDNAFTSTDYTAYFQQLEKSHLSLAFKLEADRMENLVITKAAFDKEIKVVMEERRWRVDDDPHAKVNEAFQAACYQAHPYGRPVVGFMNDLENMTYEDAKQWYDTWYAPNNATLVVVGDVDGAEVFALAKQYFGHIKEKTLPPRKPQVEPVQLGARRIEVKAPAKLPYVQMGVPVPTLVNPMHDWEPYALEVLDWVLSGNSAARLNQHLVRDKQIAISVGAGYRMINRGHAGQFELYGTPNKDVSMEDLEAALLAEVDAIKENGVTQAELNRVKAGVIAGDVYQRDSMYSQATQLGSVVSMGYSHDLLTQYAAKVRAVTSEQVQAVAKKYFKRDQLTIATLDPQPVNSQVKPSRRSVAH